jgi:hypothetical protein
MQAGRLTPWFRQSLFFFAGPAERVQRTHTTAFSLGGVHFCAGSGAASALQGPSTTGVKNALLVR